MLTDLDNRLRAYLNNHVDISDGSTEQATESHDYLVESLIERFVKDATLPRILRDSTFLFGSFVRGTKPKPLDDIDLMIVLDGDGLYAKQEGRMVGRAAGSGLINNPFTATSRYQDAFGNISSRKVLDVIREEVNSLYPRSEVRKDGQAVNAWLDSYGFGIDIVPAFFIRPYGNLVNPHYYIPLGSGSDMWLQTNPRVDLSRVESHDRSANQNFRPAVRLIRVWNRESNAARLGSFHVDVLALKALENVEAKLLQSPSYAMFAFFNAVTPHMTDPCPQLTGFEPYIDANLSDDHRIASINAAARAEKNVAISISHAIKDDMASAYESMSGVLGSSFPTSV